MFPEWSSVGACSFGRVPVTFYIVVELDFCVQSGGDVHRGAFLYPSHGTHRFPYGARCSRSNNQRTGEEVIYPAKVNRAVYSSPASHSAGDRNTLTLIKTANTRTQ